MWGADVARGLGLSLTQFWAAVETCRWVELVAGGYAVSARGRADLGLAPVVITDP